MFWFDFLHGVLELTIGGRRGTHESMEKADSGSGRDMEPRRSAESDAEGS
jgi:hypothetical protein